MAGNYRLCYSVLTLIDLLSAVLSMEGRSHQQRTIRRIISATFSYEIPSKRYSSLSVYGISSPVSMSMWSLPPVSLSMALLPQSLCRCDHYPSLSVNVIITTVSMSMWSLPPVSLSMALLPQSLCRCDHYPSLSVNVIITPVSLSMALLLKSLCLWALHLLFRIYEVLQDRKGNNAKELTIKKGEILEVSHSWLIVLLLSVITWHF